MSNKNENDRLPETGDDPADTAGKTSGGNSGSTLTIEEHAKKLKIDAPVFQAVMQCENWAGGKKVTEAVFKKAVDGFLNAPMGGIASKGGK